MGGLHNDLLSQGHKLVLIYPVPEINKYVPRELKKKIYDDSFKLELDYIDFEARTMSTFQMLDSLDSENIHRVYPHKLLCNNTSGKCITSQNNNILYTDFDHLSNHGVELISPSILQLPVFRED